MDLLQHEITGEELFCDHLFFAHLRRLRLRLLLMFLAHHRQRCHLLLFRRCLLLLFLLLPHKLDVHLSLLPLLSLLLDRS